MRACEVYDMYVTKNIRGKKSQILERVAHVLCRHVRSADDMFVRGGLGRKTRVRAEKVELFTYCASMYCTVVETERGGLQ